MSATWLRGACLDFIISGWFLMRGGRRRLSCPVMTVVRTPHALGILSLVVLLTSACIVSPPRLMPVPDPSPSALPPAADASMPGICGRTPEVQVAIIRELAVEGPRMSCGAIDASELYRLRTLRVDADYLLPGDFLDLVNLRELDAVVAGRFPLAPGVFAGMPSLRRLDLTVERRDGAPGSVPGLLAPGVFGELEGLEHLGLRGRRARVGFHLDRRSLRGLDGLVELRVDSVAVIFHNALSDMSELRRVRLNAVYTPPHLRDQRPVLPPGLFAPLPGLEHIHVRHFR